MPSSRDLGWVFMGVGVVMAIAAIGARDGLILLTGMLLILGPGAVSWRANRSR